MFDRPFKAIDCERYACDPDRFSATVFRRCLYRHALPVALLLGGLRAQLFAEDRRAIEQFGIAQTLEQVRSTLEDLAYRDNPARQMLNDVPASYHGGAGALNFADGHAEIRAWIDPRTKPRVTEKSIAQHLSTPNNPDVTWLQARTTAER